MKAARDRWNRALRLIKDKNAESNLKIKKQEKHMKETLAAIRARIVHDVLDALNSAEVGLKAWTQRQAAQPGRWKKKSGQGKG